MPLPESHPSFSVSLYLLISIGFGTKSHLGTATCQLRWCLYTEKTASLQHLSATIKDISVYTLKPPPNTFSPSLPPLPPPLPRTLLFTAAKTSHTLDRNQAKCGTLLPLHVSLRLFVTSQLFSSPSGSHASSQTALFSVFLLFFFFFF